MAYRRSRAAAIALLGTGRYESARVEFERAYDALTRDPPGGRHAIRGVFDACEIVFKLMFPNAPRLGGKEIIHHLKPFVDSRYATADRATRVSAERMLRSLVEWVEGAHWFRHGQGEEQPTEPPLEIAVLLISTGAAQLRWLTSLDIEAARLAEGRTSEGTPSS